MKWSAMRGLKKHVHARVGESNLTLRCEKDASFKEGDDITFWVRPSGIHIFSDGLRIPGINPESIVQ